MNKCKFKIPKIVMRVLFVFNLYMSRLFIASRRILNRFWASSMPKTLEKSLSLIPWSFARLVSDWTHRCLHHRYLKYVCFQQHPSWLLSAAWSIAIEWSILNRQSQIAASSQCINYYQRIQTDSVTFEGIT